MSAAVEENTAVADPTSTLMLAVVKIRNEEGKLCKATGEVISASPTGAGFYVDRECKPGRLVQMMIPIEPHLRSYDHEKELYRIWGLVQHCQKLPGEAAAAYHMGVAFIGKDAPQSYHDDPMQSYRICGMNDDGLWKVQEALREFKPRKDPRYPTAVDHYLAVVDNKNASLKGERTTTVNVSKSGAAVITTLDLNVGDRVKFISESFDFSGLAVVCNRRDSKDGKRQLSLQFVGAAFPVERLSAKAQKPAEKEEPALA